MSAFQPQPRPAAPASLTPREFQVATAVSQGCSNAEIAARLQMSVATVKAHVSRLLAKLGAENRVQIALLVESATPGRGGVAPGG